MGEGVVRDQYTLLANQIAEVARLAAQVDDRNRNILGVTQDALDRAKIRLADQFRQIERSRS